MIAEAQSRCPKCSGLLVSEEVRTHEGKSHEVRCLACGLRKAVTAALATSQGDGNDRSRQTTYPERHQRAESGSSKKNGKAKVRSEPTPRRTEVSRQAGPGRDGRSRTRLQVTIDWYRWEFLRRSDEYKAEWARLKHKYKGKPKGQQGAKQWEAEQRAAGEGFVIREQEEKAVAVKYDLYDLHPPNKRFPERQPPEFGHRPAVRPVIGPSMVDLYRDPQRPWSPVLKDGYALVMVDLLVSDEDLAADLQQLVEGLRKPPELRKDVFVQHPGLMKSLRAEVGRGRINPTRRPNKTETWGEYLKAWDRDQELRRSVKVRQTKLERIAEHLWPTEDVVDTARRAADYVEKANRLVQAAVSCEFPPR